MSTKSLRKRHNRRRKKHKEQARQEEIAWLKRRSKPNWWQGADYLDNYQGFN